MPSARTTVWIAAVLAVLGRFPSALWPMRPDEAGFLLVARSWEPAPDSMFGTYWVDRPPEIIGIVDLADRIGGEYALRVVAALGLGLLVLAAAAFARRLCAYAGGAERGDTDRVAAWTAVATAALGSNALADAVSAKGEVLAIPLVMAACWLSLAALARRSVVLSFAAGLASVLAVGMKQNIAGGLVFGGVLLVGALVARRIDGRAFARLAGGALLGAAVPVVGTVVWVLRAGVDLGAVWYATVGFRSDAYATIASQPSGANGDRAVYLATIFVTTGMALGVVWFLASMPRMLRRMAVPAIAALAMLAFDLAAVFLSGSYWRTYLVVLVPSVAVAMACLLASEATAPLRRRLSGRVTRVVAAAMAISAVVSLVGWTTDLAGGAAPTEYYTGEAIGSVAQPGDTLVVYGGRADIQLASGLDSPYEHLWSLPMRTLDPDLAQLRDLLTGPRAPTWFVEFTALDTWTEAGTTAIAPELIERYFLVTTACGSYRIYHLKTVSRQRLDVDCSQPWRRVFGHPY